MHEKLERRTQQNSGAKSEQLLVENISMCWEKGQYLQTSSDSVNLRRVI
jgi:hypothetical protein